MLSLEQRFSQLSSVLGDAPCPICKGRPGRRCPECEVGIDHCESAISRSAGGDRAHYCRLQATFAALEGGRGSTALVLDAATPIEKATRAGLARLLQMSMGTSMTDATRELRDRLEERLQGVDEALNVFVGAIRRNDFFSARHGLRILRALLQDVDVVAGQASAIKSEAC